MATIEVTEVFDDLDNRIQSGVETVTFFDPTTGQKREIELGEANRKHFANHLEKLGKYLEASRLVETAKPKAAAKANGEQAKIRAWAKANGFEIGDRGRIKAEIVDAYNKAQGDTTGLEVDPEAVQNTQDRADETGLESAPVTEADVAEMLAEVQAESEVDSENTEQ